MCNVPLTPLVYPYFFIKTRLGIDPQSPEVPLWHPKEITCELLFPYLGAEEIMAQAASWGNE
jgi:hypothetical protein